MWNNLEGKICACSSWDWFLISHFQKSFLIQMSWIPNNLTWPHFFYLCTLFCSEFIQWWLQAQRILGSYWEQQTARVTNTELFWTCPVQKPWKRNCSCCSWKCGTEQWLLLLKKKKQEKKRKKEGKKLSALFLLTPLT